MNKKITIFSIYTGSFYEIEEDKFPILDDGQIPLLPGFEPCRKCYERGYTGFSSTNYMYIPCKCVNGKYLDKEKINKKFNIEEQNV
jgi:hypothetical protein